MWTHHFFKDPPQNSGTVSVPEYKVETLYPGTNVAVYILSTQCPNTALICAGGCLGTKCEHGQREAEKGALQISPSEKIPAFPGSIIVLYHYKLFNLRTFYISYFYVKNHHVNSQSKTLEFSTVLRPRRWLHVQLLFSAWNTDMKPSYQGHHRAGGGGGS